MSYTKEREQFIATATKEGLSLDTILKLLRHASTLQRLAIAQCNGDYPYNGDRDRPFPQSEKDKQRWNARNPQCPKCEATCNRETFKFSSELKSHVDTRGYVGKFKALKICPDCRTQELVSELLKVETDVTAIFGGDPRGAVLRLSTPNFPYDECGRNGANGLYVPAGER